jgi:aspartate aminotransferase-like enzyme
MGLVFKIARTNEEFEEIHALNYKTFVDEIPQHEENKSKKRVDPFHSENTYLICLKNNKLVGMLAVRGQRPFSIDHKLGDIENYLPIKTKKPCEIRLLAVDKEYRNGKIFFGLAQLLARYCLKEGYDIGVISGTTREEKLYSQMGFQPFAHKVGTEDALYQPMFLSKGTFDKSLAGRLLVSTSNFLPGPVFIEEPVKNALSIPPLSHRSEQFTQLIDSVKGMLCKMTQSRFVQILLGSGTLANDVIAGQLTLLSGKGLILVNGEFGNRLVDHARRAGLNFSMIEKKWGEEITSKEVEVKLQSERYEWVWTVHCETSTGMLQNTKAFQDLCLKMDVKLCLDCISSIGTVPLDLSDVYLASGVSGKAIGSYTGLSFVFHQYKPQPSDHLPRYLDLGMSATNNSVAFSHSSNLMSALEQALSKFHSNDEYSLLKEKYEHIRSELEEMSLSILTPEDISSPAILTIALPPNVSSKFLGDDLYLQGFHLHYDSHYLKERNWIQIATMSKQSEKDIQKMLSSFKALINFYLKNSEVVLN